MFNKNNVENIFLKYVSVNKPDFNRFLKNNLLFILNILKNAID
jgi:hypothetical protein